MEDPGFGHYRFKILLADPKGVWSTIWFADTATLEEAKTKADQESRERLELNMAPRECHLTVIDRTSGEEVYCTCGFHDEEEEESQP